MPKRLRLATFHRTARRVRRQSHTVHRARLIVTLCILGALLAAVCVYGFAQHDRLDAGVDVVVGTALMARLPLPAEGEDVPVLQALEDVAVRPTSQQTLVFLGRDFSLEHTAEEAQDLRFAGAGGSLLLKDASGRTLGAVTGIYLPTDETSVKPLDET